MTSGLVNYLTWAMVIDEAHRLGNRDLNNVLGSQNFLGLEVVIEASPPKIEISIQKH